MKCIKERLAEVRKTQNNVTEENSSARPGMNEEERKVKDFLGYMLLSKADMSLEELAINTADLLGAGIDTVSYRWNITLGKRARLFTNTDQFK